MAESVETILVADDNPAVLSMLQVMLERLGYRVVTAKDGEEAFDLFEKEQQSINMLLFDVIMPKMNGCDAAFKIRGQRPDIPLLFLTGYKDELADEEFERLGEYTMIPKPLSIAYLGQKVQEMLHK